MIENRRDDGFMNVADHDSYTDGVPHASFARLRRDDPVHWTVPTDGMKGFWSVTRHADILEANGKPDIFPRRRAFESKIRRGRNIWPAAPFRRPIRRNTG